MTYYMKFQVLNDVIITELQRLRNKVYEELDLLEDLHIAPILKEYYKEFYDGLDELEENQVQVELYNERIDIARESSGYNALQKKLVFINNAMKEFSNTKVYRYREYMNIEQEIIDEHDFKINNT